MAQPSSGAGPCSLTGGTPQNHALGAWFFIPKRNGYINLGWRSDNDWKPFAGTIDDVAFYSKALTLDQIQAHYQATVKLGITKSGNSIVLSWPFGTLQQADSVTGAFADVSPAPTSPYTVTIGSTPKYYRVKVQ